MEKEEKNSKKEPSSYEKFPTIVVTGSARLPENITASHVYGFFSIDIEIDSKSEEIVDVSCSLIPSIGEKIIGDALLGYKFKEGISNAKEQLERRFFSVTKRAIISALQDSEKWFKKFYDQKKN